MSDRPEIVIAREQLGRWWAAGSSVTGVSFVEPTSSVAGTIYAGPLPPRDHRNTLAASITDLASLPTDTNDPTEQLGMRIAVRAENQFSAHSLLRDVRDLIRPSGRFFVDTLLGGVIGAPPLADGQSKTVWRFLRIDLRTEPQTLSLAAGEAASEEGDAEAHMDIDCTVAPATITGDAAFSVYNDGDGGSHGGATMTIAAGTLTLSTLLPGGTTIGDTTAYALADYTFGELRDAIAAIGDGWVVSAVDGALANTEAATAACASETNVFESGNAADVVAVTVN